MRHIYNRSFVRAWATGEDTEIIGETVDPGWVLHVHSCFAYAPEREANDDIIVGVRTGGQDLILMAQATAAAQKGSAVAYGFYLGEGQALFADFPDVDNGDEIGLHVSGVLMRLKDWETGEE